VRCSRWQVTACSLPVHCLFTACSLHIHCIFTDNALLFIAHATAVHCLCNTYLGEERRYEGDYFSCFAMREHGDVPERCALCSSPIDRLCIVCASSVHRLFVNSRSSVYPPGLLCSYSSFVHSPFCTGCFLSLPPTAPSSPLFRPMCRCRANRDPRQSEEKTRGKKWPKPTLSSEPIQRQLPKQATIETTESVANPAPVETGPMQSQYRDYTEPPEKIELIELMHPMKNQ
jgi:hypothetical protein